MPRRPPCARARRVARRASRRAAGRAVAGGDAPLRRGAASLADGIAAAMTSPLVIRPPRPVPSTPAGSTARSAIILRAAGKRGRGRRAPEARRRQVRRSGRCAVAAVAVADGRRRGEPRTAPRSRPWPSLSMTAITSWPVTVAPSPCRISTSTPACGAGSSSTTLSVSTSTRFSSRATLSPSFLCQLTSVASATDSGNCGTLLRLASIRPSRNLAACLGSGACLRWRRASRRRRASARTHPRSAACCCCACFAM